jgi:hypothetical protein
MAVVEDHDVVARRYSPAAGLVYALFGLLEALLALRFVFRLLGANPAASFVSWLYGFTDFFIAPFYGIFGQPVYQFQNVVSVFDTATLVAIIVYGLIGGVIARLVAGFTGRPVA